MEMHQAEARTQDVIACHLITGKGGYMRHRNLNLEQEIAP